MASSDDGVYGTDDEGHEYYRDLRSGKNLWIDPATETAYQIVFHDRDTIVKGKYVQMKTIKLLDEPAIIASPQVWKIAEEHNVDLAQIEGTGDGGRITKDDVAAFLKQQAPAAYSSITISMGSRQQTWDDEEDEEDEEDDEDDEDEDEDEVFTKKPVVALPGKYGSLECECGTVTPLNAIDRDIYCSGCGQLIFDISKSQQSSSPSAGRSVSDAYQLVVGQVVDYDQSQLVQGKALTIFYHGFLSSSSQIYLHWGKNGWQNAAIIDEPMVKRSDGFWQAKINIPIDAAQMNLAFHDGSGRWDNNTSKNWNVAVRTTQSHEQEKVTSQPSVTTSAPIQVAGSPRQQGQDRYQPQGGKWRLGRNIRTGGYVEAPQAGRKEGLYIIGLPGTGKTGLIENLIIQDIKQGMGVGLLDPHGDVTQAVLARIPDRREQDVIYLDITDYHSPFGVNLFDCSDITNPIEVQKTVDQIMHVFEKLLGVSRDTPLILQYLRNCTYTLIANPGYTMADIPLLLTDKNCRKQLVANVKRLQTRLFWQQYEQMKPNDQLEQIASIQRRVDEFLQDLIVPIVGQPKTTIDLRQVMDEGKILLVKLSAQLDSVTSLIGSLLIALFLNAAYARPENKRRQFNLYADEFQRFATEDFGTLLVEARKFGIATTIAHQARYQPGMTDGIRATTVGAANLVVFRVQPEDATELAGRFDITPQAAWEEVLEEESVEVLRPQQHERIEEQVAVEVEEDIMEISLEPIKYVHTHSHKNPVVTSQMSLLRPGIHDFILVSIMKGWEIPGTKSFTEMLVKDVVFYPYGKEYFESVWLDQGTINEIRRTYELYEKNYKTDRQVYLSPKEYEKYVGRLRREQEEKPEIYTYAYDLVWALVSGQKQLDTLKQRVADALIPFLFRSHAYSVWNEPLSKWLDPIEDKEYRKRAVEKKKLELPEEAGQVVEILVTHIQHLLVLCDELAKEENHILISTGQKRMVKRIQPHITYLTHESEKITHPRKTIMHPQRTYADVLNEVASQLANLPAFTAKVKIKTDAGLEEYTIRTLDPKQDPEKPLIGQAFQDRIARIKTRNMQDGYLREQATVETEIRHRQEQCSGHTEPPEEENKPITRRH